jgi:hypothetical protein
MTGTKMAASRRDVIVVLELGGISAATGTVYFFLGILG